MSLPPPALAALLLFAAVTPLAGQTAATPAPAALPAPTIPTALLDLRQFRELGSVLYVAAHPDDENTLFLSWLSRGRGYRTAYLSLTRGDGGQNVIGPELGDKLGVARTQELLAGRRLDGAQQFFSRALDFGFSKDYADTQRVWGRDEVIGDMVRVIRRFRPDIILTRFSPQPGGTHGHHTASAVLAIDAFQLAGDPKAYPEQIAQGLKPWQPKRVLQNGSFGRAAPTAESVSVLVEGNDPVLGIPLSTLSLRVLGEHKTQNLAGVVFGQGRGAGVGGPRNELFYPLAGDPAKTGLFEGVATTWTARYPGPGAKIDALAAAAESAFDQKNLAANVPALLALRAALGTLPADPLVTDKRTQLDRALIACLGLTVATTSATPDIVPGETLQLTHTVTSAVPLHWLATKDSAGTNLTTSVPVQSKIEIQKSKIEIPASTALTTPYWLRAEGRPGFARVDDPALIGDAENKPAFPFSYVFEIAGQQLTVADEPRSVSGSGPTEKRRRLDVVPPVSLGFTSDVTVLTPGATRSVEVEISANRPDRTGTVSLELPAGWKATPAAQPFTLATTGAKSRLTFAVTAPGATTTATLGAVATIGTATYRHARDEVNYPHIPPQVLQPLARQRAVAFDVAVTAKKIGFLPGAGDDIPAALAQLGCTVTTLTDTDLTPEKLAAFDAVVTGVRAFNVREGLSPHLAGLFAWVEQGGTVVAQYNRSNNDLKFPLGSLPRSNDGSQSPLRVTDETAPVTMLVPDNPAFNVPNKISAVDFDGWVQERGAFFPAKWDERYTPLLAMNDPGENQPNSSLLIAKHGKGYFVYTSLSFFRQLPAGVPGAYRLFANLISLRQK